MLVHLKPVQLMSISCPESLLKASESESGFLIGVALTGSYYLDNLQCHTGFVIRDNSDCNNPKFFLLHFAQDRDLSLEIITEEYGFLWLKFMKPSSLDYLVSQFQNIYQKNQDTIPYAIKYDDQNQYFDDQGNKITDEGLTCATFVMHLLQRYGFKILDFENWKSDERWQRDFAYRLAIPKPPKNTEDFLKAQFEAIGISPRFTPQQVVGGCHYFQRDALPFDFIEEKAVPETINELRKLQIIV